MCVIFVCDKVKPSEHMIARAYAQNDDGAGVAYRVTGEDGLPCVEWQKDLSLDEVTKVIAQAPLPLIAHFRIASIGGVRPELTHPFEISLTAEPELIGRTKNFVLFHNGHWDRWSDFMLTTVLKKDLVIPFGKFSDSRALAWLGAAYTQGLYEVLEKQKIVTFGPDDMNYFGDGWKVVEDVLCSNDNFVNRYVPGFSNPQAKSSGSGSSEECEHPNCSKRSGAMIEGHMICFEHINWARTLGTIRLHVCANGNCKENALHGDKYCLEHSEHIGVTYGPKTAKESAEVFEASAKMTHLTNNQKGGTSRPKQERSPFEKLLHSGVHRKPELVLTIAEREFEKGKESRLSKNGLKRIKSECEGAIWLQKQAEKGAQLDLGRPN